MDKQTKLIILLFIILIIIGGIFALKVTGVIKPKESNKVVEYSQENNLKDNSIIESTVKNNSTDSKWDISNKLNKRESKLLTVIKFIAILTVIIVILVGCYKAYIKLGMPKLLLDISFIGIPGTICALYLLFFIMPTQIFSILGLLQIIIIIDEIIFLCLTYCYFRCLDMNGAIVFLVIIIGLLMKIPNILFSIISLILAIVLLVYSIESIVKLARFFNKGILYILGLLFLPFIFLPILGYSND